MVLQECSLFILLAWTDCKWFHPLIIVLSCSEPCSLTKVVFNHYDNVIASKMHPTTMGKLLNAFGLHLHIRKEKRAVGMFNVRAHWSVKNDQIHQLFLALTSLWFVIWSWVYNMIRVLALLFPPLIKCNMTPIVISSPHKSSTGHGILQAFSNRVQSSDRCGHATYHLEILSNAHFISCCFLK